MDRRPVSSASRSRGGRKRRGGQWGLKVVWRDGWAYASGTVRANGRSIRVRRGLGIHRDAPQAAELAEAERFRIEGEVRQQAITGKKPLGSFAEAARDYLNLERDRPLGVTSLQYANELLTEFGTRPIEELLEKPDLVDAYYAKRFPIREFRGKNIDGTSATELRAAKPGARRRHQTMFDAILNTRLKAMKIPLPAYNRAKVPSRKGVGVAKELPPALVTMLVDCMSIHVRGAVATMFATGARVGMAMATHKTDFILPAGRSRVTFRDLTKNGVHYSRPLHEWAAQHMRDWFAAREAWFSAVPAGTPGRQLRRLRGDGYAEAFLSDKGRPYSRITGGVIKTAFRGARERLAKRLATMTIEEWEDAGGVGYGKPTDWIPRLALVTPHWARHNWANAMRALGFDKTSIAAGGMWEDERSVGDTYMVETGAGIEAAALTLPFGKPSTAKRRRKNAS